MPRGEPSLALGPEIELIAADDEHDGHRNFDTSIEQIHRSAPVLFSPVPPFRHADRHADSPDHDQEHGEPVPPVVHRLSQRSSRMATPPPAAAIRIWPN